MINPRVVRRYASGLYAAAARYDAVDAVQRDLSLVRRVVHENPRLRETLMGAVAPAAPKKRVLAALFQERVNPVTLVFLQVLVDHRREEVIESVEIAFRAIADERRGLARATLISAVPLTGDEMEAARARLETIAGRRVEVQQKLDASLIGGLVVRIGDRLIDGSVRGQLARIGKSLAGPTQ